MDQWLAELSENHRALPDAEATANLLIWFGNDLPGRIAALREGIGTGDSICVGAASGGGRSASSSGNRWCRRLRPGSRFAPVMRSLRAELPHRTNRQRRLSAS